MSEENKNNSGGFLLGLLVGAAAGSLLSTEKGRKILKELSEHGLESLENIFNLDEIKEVVDQEEVVEAPPEEAITEEKTVVAKKKPRLFKGIKK